MLLSIYIITTFMLAECKVPAPVVEETVRTEEVTNYTVDFVESHYLMDVLERAQIENKLVFVDFYADWCLPCKLMDEQVFTDMAIGEFLNDHFLSYRIDVEESHGKNIAGLFEITSYPTLMFMDGQGRVLVRKEGAAFHSELMELAQKAISTSN